MSAMISYSLMISGVAFIRRVNGCKHTEQQRNNRDNFLAATFLRRDNFLAATFLRRDNFLATTFFRRDNFFPPRQLFGRNFFPPRQLFSAAPSASLFMRSVGSVNLSPT